MQFSTSSSTKRSQLRRHIMLLAVLALTTPVLFRAVAGAATYKKSSQSHESTIVAGTTPTLEESMELLSSPRDFHGVVQWSRPDYLRKEEAVEDEREPASQAKNRMDASIYPIKDRIPNVDSPQVKAWIQEIDWSKVPNIPVAKGLKDAPHFPECPAKVDKSSCWWSCDEGCITDSDVMTCPDQGHWGLTYDDGPSEETRGLMSHLKSKKLTATFFIVGSRVLEYPDILKEEVAQGHHIAMHTWSHAGLTTLTNYQIVAEVKWTEKIIKDVTGLTMKYIRPPYGDTDNRVREILRQMGYTTVIWTLGWDTNDWRLLQHQVKIPEIMTTFTNALNNLALVKSQKTGALGGPITLEHDLTSETINLSKQIIPIGMARGLKPMSLAQCLNDPSPYQGGKADTEAAATGKNGTAPSTPAAGGDSGAAVSTPNNNAAAETDKKTSDTPSSKNKKSDAIMIHSGLHTLGYAAMGLSAVAYFMLTL